ncbi:hypothetical protein DUNSADRAFT_730, partial [Dunaliella salina]
RFLHVVALPTRSCTFYTYHFNHLLREIRIVALSIQGYSLIMPHQDQGEHRPHVHLPHIPEPQPLHPGPQEERKIHRASLIFKFFGPLLSIIWWIFYRKYSSAGQSCTTIDGFLDRSGNLDGMNGASRLHSRLAVFAQQTLITKTIQFCLFILVGIVYKALPLHFLTPAIFCFSLGKNNVDLCTGC